MASLSLSRIIEKMKLINLTPEIDITGIKVNQPDINRIALQMAGYFEHFESTRLQIIGYVEYSYMNALPEDVKKETFTNKIFYRPRQDISPDQRLTIPYPSPYIVQNNPHANKKIIVAFFYNLCL